ncbi:MAG: ornithine cyclodeaminase family protein [Armatimonadetes bacterium]|nr:ornithine cyclodeaminase family protein [Armatimonadota bacterium]
MALLLRESVLRELVTMRDLVPLMEQALAAFSRGGVVQPVRSVVAVADHRGFLGLMPAYMSGQEALGLKAVTFYPGNVERRLHTHMATILLLDPETGALQAILDGRLITEMRTAAVSAAATKHLAAITSPVLAFLGAGVQARSHLEALREVCRPEAVQVWSRTRPTAERFAEEMTARFGVTVVVTTTPEDAVEGAGVICTVTSSQTPVLRGAWLQPGVHINAVGASRPDWRELDTAAVVKARLFVDSRAAAVVEAGDFVQPMKEGAITQSHILAEIGEVFAGIHPGRTRPEEITLFKSLGLAVEDVATAQWAYRRALERKVGEELSLH